MNKPFQKTGFRPEETFQGRYAAQRAIKSLLRALWREVRP